MPGGGEAVTAGAPGRQGAGIPGDLAWGAQPPWGSPRRTDNEQPDIGQKLWGHCSPPPLAPNPAVFVTLMANGPRGSGEWSFSPSGCHIERGAVIMVIAVMSAEPDFLPSGFHSVSSFNAHNTSISQMRTRRLRGGRSQRWSCAAASL